MLLSIFGERGRAPPKLLGFDAPICPRAAAQAKENGLAGRLFCRCERSVSNRVESNYAGAYNVLWWMSVNEHLSLIFCFEWPNAVRLDGALYQHNIAFHRRLHIHTTQPTARSSGLDEALGGRHAGISGSDCVRVERLRVPQSEGFNQLPQGRKAVAV